MNYLTEIDGEKAPTWEGGWDKYMEVILEYISLGQDPQLTNDVGWQVSPNGTPRWYHVPWMAFDKMSDREFVHGLTNELSVFHSAFEGPGRATGTHRLPLAAREGVLAPIDIYEHFGCNGRLAGPVDEAESACLTCHQGAFTSTPGTVPVMGTNIPQIFEFDGICYEYNQANVDYFSNYKFPNEYPSGKFPDALPLDTSLQVWVAFLQYGTWKTSGQSATCKE